MLIILYNTEYLLEQSTLSFKLECIYKEQHFYLERNKEQMIVQNDTIIFESDDEVVNGLAVSNVISETIAYLTYISIDSLQEVLIPPILNVGNMEFYQFKYKCDTTQLHKLAQHNNLTTVFQVVIDSFETNLSNLLSSFELEEYSISPNILQIDSIELSDHDVYVKAYLLDSETALLYYRYVNETVATRSKMKEGVLSE